MKRGWYGAVLAAALLLPPGCRTSTDGPEIRQGTQFQSTTVSRNDLPKSFDTERLFEFRSDTVDPTSVLEKLLQADIPVVEAWLPLDNECLGPVGPRFTVVLSKEDSRIRDYNFVQGTGRLECATTLLHYTIGRN